MEGYDLDVPDTGVDNTYNSSLPTSKCGRVKQNVGEGRLSLESLGACATRELLVLEPYAVSSLMKNS